MLQENIVEKFQFKNKSFIQTEQDNILQIRELLNSFYPSLKISYVFEIDLNDGSLIFTVNKSDKKFKEIFNFSQLFIIFSYELKTNTPAYCIQSNSNRKCFTEFKEMYQFLEGYFNDLVFLLDM